ncbi:MAG: OmpA family protein, partial [Bacteroidota bacterium]
SLGANVNSSLRELAPIISPDGKTLYLMIYGNRENNGSADIWRSRVMDKDGNWGKNLHMPFPFNQVVYNQVMSVSPDGNVLMVRGTVKNGQPNQKDYSLIRRTSDGWSKPEPLIIEGYEEMNYGTMYAASLSNSGKQLILSFQEQGGSNDLYISFLKKNKTWSRPLTLGKDLNTTSTEFSPFLASDNTTLYFASNREGGLGGYDIYVTKRLDESWQKWSKPKNIGSPVNTPGNEMYYTLDALGTYAYIASTQNSVGDYDIFKIQMKEEVRPNPVILVYGKVLNGKTGKNIEASISFQVLPEGKEVGTARTNPQTGEYKIILPYGKNYAFNAKSKSFVSVSDNLDLSQFAEYKELQRNLTLMPIEIGATVRLNNIFFENAKSTLKENSFAELKKVIKLMQENSEMEILISGHTDAVGSEASNQELSEARAASVMRYLAENGIEANRISSKGFGESKPISENNTDEGKQLNRRVEFTILKK